MRLPSVNPSLTHAFSVMVSSAAVVSLMKTKVGSDAACVQVGSTRDSSETFLSALQILWRHDRAAITTYLSM